MQGVVLGFDKKTGKGILSGEDKKRYDFCLEDWRSEKTLPEEGVKVDFELIKKEVVNIYAVEPKEVMPVEKDTRPAQYLFLALIVIYVIIIDTTKGEGYGRSLIISALFGIFIGLSLIDKSKIIGFSIFLFSLWYVTTDLLS